MTRTDLSTALQLFAAAALALGLAQMMGLTNPYWAAMPVWVVHQVWREDLVKRAALRVLGTLAGAALALGLLALGPPDWGIALVLALSVGVSAGVAWWIGSVMSYGAFMLGVTLFVVLLPALAAPGMPATSAAVDRILCTLIGVVSVTAITFAFTPPRDAPPPPREMQGRCRAALRRALFCAAMSGLAAGLVMLLPRFDVLTAAMTLTVYPMILASAPDPRPIRRTLLPGVAIGMSAALVFLMLGAPLRAEGAEAVFALTLIFLAAGAVLRAHPRTAGMGLDANMCFLLLAEVGTWRHALLDAAAAGTYALAAAGVVVLVSHTGLGRAVRPAPPAGGTPG
ncbi:MAG: FUSC family protein [Paracoccaceae bacterium]